MVADKSPFLHSREVNEKLAAKAACAVAKRATNPALRFIGMVNRNCGRALGQ